MLDYFLATKLNERQQQAITNVICRGCLHGSKFVFGFSSLRLHDFLYNVFRLQGKMGKTKWKVNYYVIFWLLRRQEQPKMKLLKWDETLIC